MVSNRSRARAKARSVSNASRLAPLDVGEPVERRVGRAPLQRLAARVERQDAGRAACQVHGERAVVGEAIQRAAARASEAPGEEPVLPLVEKGPGLLTAPRVGQVAHAAFPHLDPLGDGAVGEG